MRRNHAGGRHGLWVAGDGDEVGARRFRAFIKILTLGWRRIRGSVSPKNSIHLACAICAEGRPHRIPWRASRGEGQMTRAAAFLYAMMVCLLAATRLSLAAEWQSEWESALQKAKGEGKLVLAIPPSAELRKELEPLLKQKFGIEAELIVSRGADS